MRRWIVLLTLLLSVTSLTTAQAGTTFTVNTIDDTDDSICDTDHCSLREAINAANALTGQDTIAFNIPGSNPHTIQPTSALPDSLYPVFIDGYTQPGSAQATSSSAAVLRIELDGSLAGAGASGLTIRGGNSTVRGLVINRFNGYAILIDSSGDNVVEGNYVGTDVSGTVALGNGGDPVQAQNAAIFVDNDAPNNLIGGTTPAARNLVSGNLGAGVVISGGSNNLVQGNYIGTNVTGTAALGNGSGFNEPGVAIAVADNNIIGGTIPGAGNLISGNYGNGIYIAGAYNRIEGNDIGTDVTGTVALGNGNASEPFAGSGVLIVDAASYNNFIGGTTPAARNVISGNAQHGVTIRRTVQTNYIQGNFIGTDKNGTVALGNGSGSHAEGGIHLFGSTGSFIGGTEPGAGNLISGNLGSGIWIEDFSFLNQIQGNYIGTDVTGSLPLGNIVMGVAVASGDNNTVGGTEPGAGNLIAFNGKEGVGLGTGVAILANRIHSNAELGIDIGDDGVPNPNNDTFPYTNYPVLTNVTISAGSTTVEGTLHHVANTTIHLEFFANTDCDPSGHGEGEFFLGSHDVTTDASGDAIFIAVLPVAAPSGSFITATATHPDNITSEFSACLQAPILPTNTPTNTATPTDTPTNTNTPTPTDTPTPTNTPTNTPTATPTNTYTPHPTIAIPMPGVPRVTPRPVRPSPSPTATNTPG